MSKSKKILKAQAAQKKEKKAPDRSYANKIFIAVAAVVAAAIIVLVCFEQFHREVVAKVGENKIYKDELMYYVKQAETQYGAMDSIYQQIYGSSYWTYTNEDGVTGEEQAKNGIEQAMIQNEILYQEAMKKDAKLGEEDKKTADEDAKTAFDGITSSKRNSYGITLKKFKDLSGKIAIAGQYKQELIDGFDIDDAAIKDGIDYDQYRQYDILYYFASTKTTDADGGSVDLTEDEKKAVKDEIQALKAKADAGEDFAKLIPEGEESKVTANVSSETGVTKENTSFDDTVNHVIYKMQKDEVSDVIEAPDGYYLIKMVNNDSSEAYDSAVSDAISKEEDSRFNTEYQDNIYPSYKVDIEASLWDDITMGSMFTE